tara:strand:+ start:941 stop:1303 length:363 start_codon:yes stop_codon:yes gene_type:complete
MENGMTKQVSDSIFIIWSSSDPEVAHNLALMYGHNAMSQNWWKRVRFIIWGPSAKLTAEDIDIQIKIKEMMASGVDVWACRACSENYDVSDELESLGINVLFVGKPVTEMLKSGWRQLTF